METKLSILIVSNNDVLSGQLKTIADNTEDNDVLSATFTDAIREMNRETRDIVILTQSETELDMEFAELMR